MVNEFKVLAGYLQSEMEIKGLRPLRYVDWSNISKDIKIRDRYTCQLCGSKLRFKVTALTFHGCKKYFEIRRYPECYRSKRCLNCEYAMWDFKVEPEGPVLVVHHIEGDLPSYDNLITLCSSCHAKIETVKKTKEKSKERAREKLKEFLESLGLKVELKD